MSILQPPPPSDNLVQQTLAKAKSLWWPLFVFSSLINLLALTSSIYMMQVFDRVITGRSIDTLIYLTLIALGGLAMMAVLDLIRSRILTRFGTWFEARLSGAALERAVESNLQGREYKTEMLRDLGSVRNFLGGSGTLTLFDAAWTPIYVLVVYMVSIPLGHICAIGGVVLFGLAWLNDRLTRDRLRDAGMKSQRALRRADAAVRNAEVLDVLGMVPGLTRAYRAETQQASDLQTEASDLSGTVTAFSKFVRLVLQIAVLGVGAYLVLERQMTAGAMIACSIIIARALAPVEQAIGSWKHTLAATQAYNRLVETLGRPSLRPEAMALPAPKGHLAVEGITFVPPGGKLPVLRGVAFEARPGTVTAVVGPSAAGKSTLARLLVGAYAPTYGNVRLDGADVFLWDRADFGRYVGYLPQDVELFSGTVRQNIARLAEADPADVVEAAQTAGAHEMILRLPQGYETEIGEGGAMLSGGQRQRLGLARAVFGRPQLIVLDEPNSSLDAEGEEALNGAILRMKQRGATVILVGHRPSILVHVDFILVMREGRVDQFGTKDEIMGRIMPKGPQRVAAGSRPAEGQPTGGAAS